MAEREISYQQIPALPPEGGTLQDEHALARGSPREGTPIESAPIVLDDSDEWVKQGPAAAAGVAPVVPRLFGRRACDIEVVRLANAWTRRRDWKKARLSMSWCVGPCMRRLFWMLIANFAVPPVFLAIGYLTAHVQQNTFHYCYGFALMGLIPWAGLCMYEEHNCVRHVTIPFAQHEAKWKVMGLNVCREERAFAAWVFTNLVATTIDVFSSITPSLFAGVIFGAHANNESPKTLESIQGMWHHMAKESPVMQLLGSRATLYSVTGFFWLLQFSPLVYCVLKAWPGWGQWQAGALDWNKNKPYATDLEFEVVHQVRPSDGVSQTNKPRPLGNRFYYFTVCKELILTGAAFCFVGDAVGFASVTLIQRQFARASAYYQWENLQRFDVACSSEDFETSVGIGKKFMQHYLSLAPTLKGRFLFKGILGDAVQLQLQITVFAMFKFLHPTRSSSLQLWIAIIVAFGKFPIVIMEVIGIVRFSRLAADVGAKLKAMSNHRQEVSIEEKRRSGSDEEQQLKDDFSYLTVMRRQSRWYLIEFCCFALLLLFMYVWAFVKLLMTHVCEDSMWNINFSVLDGCVDLPASLRSSSNDI